MQAGRHWMKITTWGTVAQTRSASRLVVLRLHQLSTGSIASHDIFEKYDTVEPITLLRQWIAEVHISRSCSVRLVAMCPVKAQALAPEGSSRHNLPRCSHICSAVCWRDAMHHTPEMLQGSNWLIRHPDIKSSQMMDLQLPNAEA
jgi:hypothetical protein